MNKYALRKAPLAVTIGSVIAGGSLQAAVITVNTADDGPVGSTPGCSLRSAVASANAGAAFDDCDSGSAGADEIEFDQGLANSSITLSENEIEITNALTITGPVADNSAGITIDGDNASRIFNINGDVPSEFEVELSSLSLTGGRNTEFDAYGGAVYASNADLKLEHVLVSGNSAQGDYGYGGGLYAKAGNAVLINSTVSGNSAQGKYVYGGGLFLRSGNATLINSTVSGNSVAFEPHCEEYDGYEYCYGGASGGGLFVNSGDATLTHTTVAANTTNGGASGVHRIFSGELILNNSLIVQDNGGGTACNSAANAAVNSLATDTSCTDTATDAEAITLAPLADNGGSTETHALDVSSVAIDAAGDCNIDFGIHQDQRGEPRPGADSAFCDIGAYEFQGGSENEVFSDRFEE